MLTSKGNFKLGNVEYAPKSLKINFESLAGPDSGRTDDGAMHIDWIYRKIRKLEIEMPPMTSEELSQLLSQIAGQEYAIEYYDPIDDRNEVRSVYTSTAATDLYSGVVRNGLYQGVQFNAIELEGEA